MKRLINSDGLELTEYAVAVALVVLAAIVLYHLLRS